jgi:hypothetical protein
VLHQTKKPMVQVLLLQMLPVLLRHQIHPMLAQFY